MNYIKEINAFYNELEKTPLTASAIALWYALMHMCNKFGWPKEFPVAVGTLSLKSGLSERSVSNARNELKTKGYISFKSRGGNKAALYQISCLSEIFADTISGNASGNVSDIRSGYASGNVSAYLNINETKQDDGDDNARKLFTAYQEIFVTGMNSIQQQDLLEFLDKGMDVDLMILDFKTAKRNDAGFSYAFAIIKNQFEAGVKTIAQHEAVEARRQAAVGGELSAQYSSNRRTSSAQRETTVRKSITGGKVGRI